MKTDLFQVYLNAEGTDGGNGDNSTPSKPEEKKFTQEEVNSIVSGRLSKEKEKYADYDNLKTKASELDSLTIKYTDLSAKYTASDEALAEIYGDLFNSIDETKRTLIPEQLSVLEKIKFINKNKENLFNKPAAQTPPPENKPKGDAGLYGGKYATIAEYANADPKGYLEARKAGKI